MTNKWAHLMPLLHMQRFFTRVEMPAPPTTSHAYRGLSCQAQPADTLYMPRGCLLLCCEQANVYLVVSLKHYRKHNLRATTMLQKSSP